MPYAGRKYSSRFFGSQEVQFSPTFLMGEKTHLFMNVSKIPFLERKDKEAIFETFREGVFYGDFFWLKMVKLIPDHVADHRWGYQQLIGPQEGISCKVDQGQYL
jgi:hypothetical protein